MRHNCTLGTPHNGRIKDMATKKKATKKAGKKTAKKTTKKAGKKKK
jgi:hypothetical protein